MRSQVINGGWQKITTLPAEPLRSLPQRRCGTDVAGDHGRASFRFWVPFGNSPPRTRNHFRYPPEARLRVFRSRTGGKSWEPLSQGLPQENAFMSIYREGMAADSLNPAGLYFGTNTGKIFNSDDEGNTWRILADNLPP